jgi:zinc/manganese transport system substrate-binding protein
MQRGLSWLIASLALLATTSVFAQSKVHVAASFTILADLARNVGGDRVTVTSLVGPNGDVHSYVPTPADAKTLTGAKLVVLNGLGLEGATGRFMESAAKGAQVVIASTGITPLRAAGEIDPHAWQSIANAKIYVANIRDALIAVDPADKAVFETNAAAYLQRLDALDAEIKAEIAKIPPERRKLITTHDAYGYFASTYGIAFIAPHGLAPEAEGSARDVARIIKDIRAQHIPAVFPENVTDPRLVEEIAREAGARVGGILYSDALTPPDGPAPTYIDMMRHNVSQLVAALVQ